MVGQDLQDDSTEQWSKVMNDECELLATRINSPPYS